MTYFRTASCDGDTLWVGVGDEVPAEDVKRIAENMLAASTWWDTIYLSEGIRGIMYEYCDRVVGGNASAIRRCLCKTLDTMVRVEKGASFPEVHPEDVILFNTKCVIHTVEWYDLVVSDEASDEGPGEGPDEGPDGVDVGKTPPRVHQKPGDVHRNTD